MAISKHTAEQKEFIVARLATFETPSDIAVAFAARFPDTACTVEDVRATHPHLVIVAPDLYALFKSERARIMDDPDAAPFAEQRARLIVLSRQVERYEANNQYADARTALRQIAEELGIVAGKGGKAGAKPAADAEPIDEIRVTYIDPKEPTVVA